MNALFQVAAYAMKSALSKQQALHKGCDRLTLLEVTSSCCYFVVLKHLRNTFFVDKANRYLQILITIKIDRLQVLEVHRQIVAGTNFKMKLRLRNRVAPECRIDEVIIISSF